MAEKADDTRRQGADHGLETLHGQSKNFAHIESFAQAFGNGIEQVPQQLLKASHILIDMIGELADRAGYDPRHTCHHKGGEKKGDGNGERSWEPFLFHFLYGRV